MSSGATLALFARLIVSLSVVFGLMWFLARVVRRRGIGGVGGGGQKRAGVQVDIVARRTLSRNTSIAVVRAGNQPATRGPATRGAPVRGCLTRLGASARDAGRGGVDACARCGYCGHGGPTAR